MNDPAQCPPGPPGPEVLDRVHDLMTRFGILSNASKDQTVDLEDLLTAVEKLIDAYSTLRKAVIIAEDLFEYFGHISAAAEMGEALKKAGKVD